MAFDLDLIESRPGILSAVAQGPAPALKRLEAEAGGHRWQRIPPTERRGRVHTSTVTVAVLPMTSGSGPAIAERDLVWETMRGSGAGGQHRNVTESAVRVRHLPTGLEARVCAERSQHRNRALALEILSNRVRQQLDARNGSERDALRQSQVGSGMRGDKIRTYRVRDNQVTDHRHNKRWTLDAVKRGDFECHG